MTSKYKALWITRTAIFIALLVVLQAATAPLSNALVTGSIVNMLLIVSVMTCGLVSGLSVSAVSPVMAKLFGIGPLWSLIPFIVAGNAVLVTIWHFVGNIRINKPTLKHIFALAAAATAAAAAKFLTLYAGIVKLAIPLLLHLPEAQAAAVAAMFSLPQLITAAVGGAAAVLLLPPLQKAIGKTARQR